MRVREAADIVAVISEHVQLKRVGRRWLGLCPFHAEKSPSFSVNQEQGLYYCFGCGAKGDVITFVREIEHLDFVGAVEFLAGKAGITLRYTDRDEGEGRKQRARLLDAMARAVDVVPRAPAVGARRGHRPGLPAVAAGSTATRCGPTRSAGPPRGGTSWPRRSRLPDDVLVDAGLARINRAGAPTTCSGAGCCSRSSTSKGDPVAFGGRVLPGGDGAKYKNSAESAIYAKSKVLYGLNWAKGAIVAADEAIVCEGYTDVIGFAAAGAAPGGGHLRHGADRGALPHAQELRPAGGAGLRRRRRRPERGRPLLRVGAGLRHRRGRGRAAAPASTRPTWPGPIPRRWPPPWPTPRPSSASGSTGCSTRPRWSRPRAGPAPPRRPWR